ncbi:hypothetical protein E4U42_006769 [Claviceps africana]|uniref:Transmembrane protein n=1 Tax=Claviceps africana TaxID=83212 RepID=A0A8K0JBB5_9HYPO|nr:hypothetical protein E4U42_006769 [Claviceps africana]
MHITILTNAGQQIILVSVTVFAAVSFVAVAFIKAGRQQQEDVRKEGWAGFRSFLNALVRRRKRGQSRYDQASEDNFDEPTQAHPLESTSATSIESGCRRQILRQAHLQRMPQEDFGVERNLSVRSVITLPPYRALAAHDERLVAREGERGGMDTIVDLPAAEDHESLRNEEMEAIYQIRLARRQRAVEREGLGRQRQHAHQRGGCNALSEAPSQSRAAGYDRTVEELRQDVIRIQKQRQRAVSSVSYADLGVATHNGTRLRASSIESERMGLLSNAASFALSTIHGDHLSGFHRRERSTSSLLSIDNHLHPVHSAPRVCSQSTKPARPSKGVSEGSRPDSMKFDFRVGPLPPPEYESVSLDSIEGRRPDNLCCAITDS